MVYGEGAWLRNVEGAGGSLLSGRWIEDPATSGHAVQDILNAGAITMRWSHAVFDDLSFPGDWGHDPDTGEFLFPASGDYLIVCYIQIEPNVAFTSGSVSVVFEANFIYPLDTWWEQVSGHVTDPGTKLSLSAVHRVDLALDPGAGFSVDVHSWDVNGDGYVSRAAISITKLRDL